MFANILYPYLVVRVIPQIPELSTGLSSVFLYGDVEQINDNSPTFAIGETILFERTPLTAAVTDENNEQFLVISEANVFAIIKSNQIEALLFPYVLVKAIEGPDKLLTNPLGRPYTYGEIEMVNLATTLDVDDNILFEILPINLTITDTSQQQYFVVSEANVLGMVPPPPPLP